MQAAIQPIQLEDPRFLEILQKSDDYLQSLYPPESNHLETPLTLHQAGAICLGLYINNELASCGCVKVLTNDNIYGEVKRVFTLEKHRGKGFAKEVIKALEYQLRARTISLVRLETGIWQPAALAMYAALGYRNRPPFGDYSEDPLSVFMEKAL
ncbi:MAG: GNAT family N-acetyltransferase [Comamonas sp.]